MAGFIGMVGFLWQDVLAAAGEGSSKGRIVISRRIRPVQPIYFA
jgi:hypothetical protein